MVYLNGTNPKMYLTGKLYVYLSESLRIGCWKSHLKGYGEKNLWVG